MSNMDLRWLFEKAGKGWLPQLGWAGADKKGKMWLPGNKVRTIENIRNIMDKSPYTGCTQCAYRRYQQLQAAQRCLVCWVGLDIDEGVAHDRDKGFFVSLAMKEGGSIRYSQSGNGYHLIFRLDKPIECDHSQSNMIVKTITKPLVDELKFYGRAVCKSDKGMFWMNGGKNAWLLENPNFYTPAEPVEDVPPAEKLEPLAPVEGYSRCIREWVERFQEAGVIRNVGEKNPIYVGKAVAVLRKNGQTVHTKSPMSGNGDVNGYLDIKPDYIRLWTFVDNAKIWSCQDTSSMLK